MWLTDAKSWLTGKYIDAGKERLRMKEGGHRGWDGWMASSAQWTWVWANSKEIVKDKEAWRAAVDGVAKSQTWLNNNKKGRLTSQEGVIVKCALGLLLHWIPCILPVHKVSLLIFSGIGQPCGSGNTCQVDQALSLGLSMNYKPHMSVLSKFVS